MKDIQLKVQGRSYAFPVKGALEGTNDASSLARADAQDIKETRAASDVSAMPWEQGLALRLGAYLRAFPDEEGRLERLTDSMEATRTVPSLPLGSRRLFPGHVTGSGIVAKDGQALLIRHPIIGRWLQPGGHLEGNEAPEVAAAREAEEETGWRVAPVVDACGQPILLDIDIHAIPENPKKGEPAHWHYDFLYVFAPVERVTTPELPVKWISIEEIDEPRLVKALSKVPMLHAALSDA
ncbi:NUDIX hydrolase [Robbsia andropogonis]|nr:NUDIX domain-containing protein [Robbsia andropogonis]